MALLQHALNSSLTMVHPLFLLNFEGHLVRAVKTLIRISILTQGGWSKVRGDDSCSVAEPFSRYWLADPSGESRAPW